MCGEKFHSKMQFRHFKGSPPRVRGKESQAETVPIELGITPACAGKRLLFVYSELLTQDHPRVCGEKFQSISIRSGTTGSPPRVRGKGNAGNSEVVRKRITPACAGKSGGAGRDC